MPVKLKYTVTMSIAELKNNQRAVSIHINPHKVSNKKPSINLAVGCFYQMKDGLEMPVCKLKDTAFIKSIGLLDWATFGKVDVFPDDYWRQRWFVEMLGSLLPFYILGYIWDYYDDNSTTLAHIAFDFVPTN